MQSLLEVDKKRNRAPPEDVGVDKRRRGRRRVQQLAGTRGALHQPSVAEPRERHSNLIRAGGTAGKHRYCIFICLDRREVLTDQSNNGRINVHITPVMKLIKKKKGKKPRYAETSVAIDSVSGAQLVVSWNIEPQRSHVPRLQPHGGADEARRPLAGETHAWCDLTTL